MDAAYQFMLAIQSSPVEECGEPLASLPEAAKSSGSDRALHHPCPMSLDYPASSTCARGLLTDFLASRARDERLADGR